jgi:hypothetical protein
MSALSDMTGRDAINKYCDGRLSDRPEYYSGRGVTTSDLGPEHLKMIYDGIVKDFGQEAGDQFLLMIEGLKDLSATNFLNQFFGFWDQGRVWQGSIGEETDIDVGPDVPGRESVAFATALGFLGGQHMSSKETEMASTGLKLEFFARIGYKPKIMKEAENVFGFPTYG